MASIRRSMFSVQRDGAGENGEATLDHSPSPKLFRTRGYLAFCRLLVASISSLDFPMVLNRIRVTIASFFLPRVSLSSEKMKPKGLLWKRAFIHFSLCFMIGIFIGFTPFISVDFSKNLMSKHQTFSFEVDLPANNAGGLTDIVRNEDLLADNLAFKENVSLGTIPRWETRRETLGTSGLPPPLHDLDIVYRKLLIIVTPTYARPFQAHYLSRLAHTLRVVPPPLLWIVVEMSSPSSEIAEILRGSGVMYRHLVCNKNISHIKDRGIHQKNVALSHIEKHQLDGMVYFADDNNVYSVDLFEQMRGIRHFGTWPVATLMENKKQVSLEGPICNGSQVIGWHTNERNRMGQRFHADMSGFAFNSTILWDPKGWHRPILESIRHLDTVKKGLQVSTFIEQLVEDESQMEGSPKDCSRIMVWHLNLEAPELFYPQGWTIWKNLEVVVPLT